jgi:LysM repeat protein
MIAEQYHTTVEELKKTNRLTHDTLQPNTVLLIPTVTQVIGAPTETETKPHSVALKKFVPKTGLGYYRVYYGDTLNSISKKFGVSITQIQKWNRLMNGEQVWPGQMLIVRKNVRQ